MSNLGTDIKRTRTSIMELSMDILQILDEIDDIDFDDIDDESKDDNNLKYNKKQQIIKTLSEHQFNQVTNLNMQKLMVLEEIEHSITIDDENKQIDNDDAHSHKSSDTEIESDNIEQEILNRARSKAKTQEHINYLPISYNKEKLIQLSQSESILETNTNENIAYITSENETINNIINTSTILLNTISETPSDLYIEKPIREIARILYDLVDKKNRKYKLDTFTDCFIGRAAINIMIENNLCLHRSHGVQLCRTMEELNIIHHVLYENGKHKFFSDNKDSYYQFTIDDDHKSKNSDLDIAFGLYKKIETQKLLKLQSKYSTYDNNIMEYIKKDSDGYLPQYIKLPSQIFQTFDLSNLSEARKRHKSTMSLFKETANKYIELPELNGWMEKKSASGFKSWQKRWIIVRKTHILWSKVMCDTQNPLDPNERKKFNNSITLLTIKDVRAVSSKNKRKFDIITSSKIYHFKCKTSQQRNLWLNGLQLHLNILAHSMKFLRQSFIFKDT
eukprot:273030_1